MDENFDDKQFKGLAKHFNSWTPTGRANTAKATYLAIFVLYVGNKIIKKFSNRGEKPAEKSAVEPVLPTPPPSKDVPVVEFDGICRDDEDPCGWNSPCQELICIDGKELEKPEEKEVVAPFLPSIKKEEEFDGSCRKDNDPNQGLNSLNEEVLCTPTPEIVSDDIDSVKMIPKDEESWLFH